MPSMELLLQESLNSFRQEIFSGLHVAMPGIISSYDSSAGTVSVWPALRKKTASGDLLTAPVLDQVPVLLPSSDYTPVAGDFCLLIFADFCIDGFLQTGQPVIPPSSRAHDLSDAFALIGFCPAFQNLQRGGAS